MEDEIDPVKWMQEEMFRKMQKLYDELHLTAEEQGFVLDHVEKASPTWTEMIEAYRAERKAGNRLRPMVLSTVHAIFTAGTQAMVEHIDKANPDRSN